MVQMLIRDAADHDTRCKEDATIELNNVTQMESIPSPRVMTSHLFLRQLSNEIVAKQSRVIHVLRNPKDLAVSYYFLSKQMSSFQDMDFQEFAVDFINSAGCQGNQHNVGTTMGYSIFAFPVFQLSSFRSRRYRCVYRLVGQVVKA